MNQNADLINDAELNNLLQETKEIKENQGNEINPLIFYLFYFQC